MSNEISDIIANIERNLANVRSANSKIEAAAKAHASLSSQVATYVSSLRQLEEQAERLCGVVRQERDEDRAELRMAADRCANASDSIANDMTRALADITKLADERRAEEANALASLREACDDISSTFSHGLNTASASYEDKLAEIAVTLEEDRAENKTNFEQQLAILQAKLTAFQSTARSLIDAIGIVSQLDGDILRLKEDNKALKCALEGWQTDQRRDMDGEFGSVRAEVTACRQSVEGETRQLRDGILKNAKSVGERLDGQAWKLTMQGRDLRNVKILIYVLLALSVVIIARLFTM